MNSRRVCFVFAISAVILIAGTAGASSESSHTERSFAATVGGTVTVDVSFHDVEVRVRPGDSIDVTVDIEVSTWGSKAKKILEKYEPQFEERGGDLKIRSRRDGGSFTIGYLNTKGNITLQVPAGIHVVIDSSSGDCDLDGDFGDVTVVCDTSSGDVTMRGAAREINADTSSGSVDLRLSRPAASVVADTSSGDVRLVGGAEQVRADTSSGSVDLAGLTGNARIDTSSGGVEARWSLAVASSRVSVDTSSGRVRLVFPTGTALDGWVDTGSGRIESDFPGKSSDDGDHLRLAGGEGAVKVQVDTSSGNIQLLTD